MCKLKKLQVACVALLALLCAGNAAAFDVSKYASQSKLATGKWVKISIPENGMYEITYNELREMGFSNPSQVRLYGQGGYRINETLNGKAVDDLRPVPVKRMNSKLLFYANGPIKFGMAGYNTVPRFTHELNPYSLVGYYFLTEESTTEVTVPKKTVVSSTTFNHKPYSLSYAYHESELMSPSNSGKEMLGEEFTGSRLLIDFDMPNIADSTIVVSACLAANANTHSYIKPVIHCGDAAATVPFTTSMSRIMLCSSEMYNTAKPYGNLKLSHPAEHAQFEPQLTFNTDSYNVKMACLDYFLITYKRYNILSAENGNQLYMGYASTRATDRFELPNASSTTQVWYVYDTNNPQEVTLSSYNDDSGKGLYFFNNAASYSAFVAFDPAKTLKKISSYEPVANQNLHGMQTPDMLIITDKIFHEQGERIAELHRNIDGIDVAVVDQDQVFNEFSSGTRDAMAYRLLCKMLYDRDPAKLKNLLLLGTGSVDNRELRGKHDGMLLTYQSDASNSDNTTFTSDDFFGFLGDNSGANVAFEQLSIGVGRMTCANVDEARSDVDKLVEYYANPDYGVWRNNTLVFSDAPDNSQYMFQGEGYKNLIDNELLTGMHVNTVHNSQYPRSASEPNISMDRKTATVGKQLIAQNLKSGMYYMTYVGHAGSIGFTKYNNMWVTSDVVGTSYKHFPIMSTACCNVAHYDGDTRGIAELMFHKRDGGAIALLTTSRSVYAINNDEINTYFIRGLFSNATNGHMPTLGEAYIGCKNAFTSANINKMSFFLLGDPAIRVNYPVSRFNITRVNGTSLTGDNAMANISPLMKFAIDAQVVNASGTVDRTFNGDATVTLYDKDEFCTTLTQSGVDRDIYFNRAKLAEISGRVVNGIFHGEMIAPKSPAASDEAVLLRVYAHKDGSDYMVNGFTKQITMLPYDESQAVNDTQAPVINNMFINDAESFSNGAVISPDALLYINVTDNEGINLQSSSLELNMDLVLDGGRSTYSDVSCYTMVDGDGRAINIEYPLSNLTEGMHTLTYTVYDVVGNSATRTICFMVGQTSTSTLTADKWPAYNDGEVNFGLETTLSQSPEFTVRVIDATGNLVWKTTASSFPVSWNMRDLQGKKVPAGLYRYYGTYNNGADYGGTSINKLIVLDAVKSAH